MNIKEYIAKSVNDAYSINDLPCSVTTVKTINAIYRLDIPDAVIDAGWGFNGAGQYGAQCGLVEGALMLLSLLCRRRNFDREAADQIFFKFAAEFEQKFGSLNCRELRPEGFAPDNPPLLCEKISVTAIEFVAEFLEKVFGIKPTPD